MPTKPLSCLFGEFRVTTFCKQHLGRYSFLFPSMGTRTASPRCRYGERPQRDSCLKIHKNTTCWPATAHDVTTGVPQYKCHRENTSSAFSSSLTGLFEACNLVRVQFSLYQMASTSKAFKIVCGSASSLFETRWHTQSLHLLFGQGARTRCPWGEICVHCELFLCKSSALVLSLFSRKEGQPSASRDSGPTAAEARTYAAAGQTVASLHTEAYQTDLLKDLDKVL